MKSPLAGIAVLFCCGILMGKYISIPFFYIWFFLFFLVLIAIFFRDKRLILDLSILTIAFLLGFASWQNFTHKNTRHIKHLIRKSPIYCTLTGELRSDPVIKKYDKLQRTSFIINVKSIKRRGDFFKTEGFVYVILTDKKPINVEYGDILNLKGILSVPPESTNPGGFNLKEHLFKSDIYGVLKVKGNLGIERTGIVRQSYFIRAIYRLRHRLSELIEINLKGDYASILKAMLLGERQDIPSYLNDLFIRTGTIHILAISGLHVGIFAFLVFVFLKTARIPRLTRYILTAVILVCYAILTGLKPPIMRATIMSLAILFALVLRRAPNTYNLLGLAALIILFVNPCQLFEAGFQLSFIAVISTVYISEKIFSMLKISYKENASHIFNKFFKILIVSFSAWIGTSPFLVYSFNIFSFVTAFANLLVIPLLGVIVASGITFVILSIINLKLGFIFSQVTYIMLILLKLIVEFFERLPFSYIYLKTPSVIGIIGYYVVLLIVLNYKRLNLRVAQAIVVMLVALNIFVYKTLIFDRADKLKITFLDVGDGDSIFIQFPGGSNMLVDAGCGGVSDVGRFTIVPFLLHNGITSLNYVLLTHPHDDHIGGLKGITEYIKIRNILDNGFEEETPVFREYRRISREKGIKTISLYRGFRIDVNKDLGVYILNPPTLDSINKVYSNINDTSIVLKLLYKDFSLLLCADIEDEAMRDLIRYRNFLEADVIKVPHHGNRSSFAWSQFLKEVAPKFAIVSKAGFEDDITESNNVINEMRLMGIKVYTTGITGAITIATDGKSYLIKKILDRLDKYEFL